MILKCFGTAGYHPCEQRQTSCYYVPDLALSLDAGTGIFRLTAELRRAPRASIDILLSHAHLDHVAGLTFLLDTLAVTEVQHIRVIGHPEKLQAIQDHLYNELIFPVEPRMEFVPLRIESGHSGGKQSFQNNGIDYRIQWMNLDHPGGSLGYILESMGKRLAYITDTTGTVDSPYVDNLNDIDLLLHECNFDDKHRELAIKTGHSWQSAVVDLVARCRPKQTYLIHHNPLAELMNCPLSVGPRENALRIAIAEDKQVIEF